MGEELKQKILLLTENRQKLGQILKPEHEGMCAAGSLCFAVNGEQIEREQIERAAKLFRKHTGILSPFRGLLSVPMTVIMAQQAEPEDYYLDIQNLYKRFNSGHLMGADYHILSAILLYDRMGSGSNWTHIYKSNELLERMSGEYRFLPDQADLPMALVWSMTGREPEAMLTEMDACYRILRAHFQDANTVQLPSQLLVLHPDSAEEKCSRLITLADLLKAQQAAPETGRELAALALLTMTGLPAEEIVNRLQEMDALLGTYPEQEAVLTEKPLRRLCEAVLLASDSARAKQADQAVEVCTVLAIAETAAVCKTRR